MEDEVFTVYDNEGNVLGEDIRAHVHALGLWHAVIHVWLYEKTKQETWIYLQQRSIHKKDFAGLFDITTAGHIDAGEPIPHAAIRECTEEIGFLMEEKQMNYVGSVKEAVFMKTFCDKEIAHVYLCPVQSPIFHLGEEVEGMYKVRKQDLLLFAQDKRKGLDVYDLQGELYQHIAASQLCQHASTYYRWIAKHMI